MADELEGKKLEPEDLKNTSGGYYTDENGDNWYYAFFCEKCNSGCFFIQPKKDCICPNDSSHGFMQPRYW